MRFRKKFVRIVGYVQPLRQFFRALVGHPGGSEHDHIGLDLDGFGPHQRIDALDDQLAVFFINAGHASAHVVYAVVLNRAAHELLVILAGGPDIHVKDVGLPAVHFVLVQHRVLGRIHAADFRAIVNPFGRIARSGAGDEHDLFRHRSVRRTAYLARRRPGSRSQPLELQSGNDVFVPSVTVFRKNSVPSTLNPVATTTAPISSVTNSSSLSKQIAPVGQVFSHILHLPRL